MEAEPAVVQIVITRNESGLKLTAHSTTEVIYNKEFDNQEITLFNHVLEDLVDELKVPS